MDNTQDYTLFHKFIKTYILNSFNGINAADPLMIELEDMMEKNNQFLYIADIIQMNVIFTSKRSIEMIGITPENVSPYHFMEATHPDDIQRLNLGRAKLIKLAQDIFIAKEGTTLVSTNFKIRNAEGVYSNFLVQAYLFYSSLQNTVFFLKIHTNIDWCKKIKNGFHYYIGNDLSYFRYPDKELLQFGNIYTKREFEIIKLIESGLNSEQIAEKLFLSHYTINAHRSNILKKTNKSHISELIYDLNERGLL
jgi:hypothetical protein